MKFTTKVGFIVAIAVVLGVSLLYLDSGFVNVDIMGFILICGIGTWMFTDLLIGTFDANLTKRGSKS